MLLRMLKQEDFYMVFLKYKKWKNKSWLKIVDEYDEWRKKNNKDDLFNFYEYKK